MWWNTTAQSVKCVSVCEGRTWVRVEYQFDDVLLWRAGKRVVGEECLVERKGEERKKREWIKLDHNAPFYTFSTPPRAPIPVIQTDGSQDFIRRGAWAPA